MMKGKLGSTRKIGTWVLILLPLLFQTSEALQCYECTYNRVTSSIGVIDNILSVLNKISNERCQLKTKNDHYEVAIKNCPEPREGYVYKCAKLEGTVETSVVDYRTIEHGCVEVALDDPETTDGCHTDLPANGVARSLLEKTFSGLSLGDITFKGRTCYNRDTVDVPTLQCPRCTWNDVETSNFLLNSAINFLESLSSQNCMFKDKKVDKYEISLRNCPPADEGYINKCGEITGEITAQVEIDILPDMEIKYKTTQRDCIQVPQDAYAYTDGCHSDLPANGPIRALILETFAGLDLGDVQFDGKACYDTDHDPIVAMGITSGSADHKPMTLTATFITNLIVLVTVGFFC